MITKNTAEVDGAAMGLLLGPVPANIFMIELETIIDTFVKKILRLSSNMIGNSNDETIFPLKLLLPDRQVARLPKAFANNSPANKDLSKTQTSKINTTTQIYLKKYNCKSLRGRLLGLTLKVGLSLMKNVIKKIAEVF